MNSRICLYMLALLLLATACKSTYPTRPDLPSERPRLDLPVERDLELDAEIQSSFEATGHSLEYTCRSKTNECTCWFRRDCEDLKDANECSSDLKCGYFSCRCKWRLTEQ